MNYSMDFMNFETNIQSWTRYAHSFQFEGFQIDLLFNNGEMALENMN